MTQQSFSTSLFLAFSDRKQKQSHYAAYYFCDLKTNKSLI